jgi:hypothetical protein
MATSRQKQALADPVTEAATAEALAEAKKRFDPQMEAIFHEMKALGRSGNAVTIMALKARFDAVAIEQKKTETVDA